MKSRVKALVQSSLKARPRASRGPWLRLAIHLGLSGLLSGCELGDNLQNLAESLGNPDPTEVERPGHLVAAGSFSSLAFDGNNTDGPFVLARSDGHLTIMRFPDGEACDVGPAVRLATALARNEDALDARVPISVPPAKDEDPSELRFVNFACKVDKLRIPGGALLSQDFTKQKGFLVETTDGKVLFADPWRNKLTTVAEKASVIAHGDRAIFAAGNNSEVWMWTLEEGELVARNADLKEVFRTGHDITGVLHTANGAGGPMFALFDAAKNLRTVLVSTPNDIKDVAANACGPQFNIGLHGRELLYFSPCDAHALQVHELETDKVFQIRSGIVDFKIAGATETGPILMYVVGPEEGASNSTMWARWGQNDPIRLGDNGHLGFSHLNSKGEVRAIVDWDGAGGRMLVGSLGDRLKEIAKSVAYFSSAGVISNFDGSNGTLERLDDDDRLQKVADKVSPLGIRNDNRRDRALFVTHYNGFDGRLVLIDGDDVRTISEHVIPKVAYYQFTAQENRITVLSDFVDKTQSATLKLPSTEYDDEGVISKGVQESVEVDWPRKGLLYSAPAAKEPGIYFARFY
jgi:hypothetical protein